MIVREAALEVGLELRRTAFHVPGSIGELRPQQIIYAAPVCGIGCWNAQLMHRIKHSSGAVGVASEFRRLCLSAVRALQRDQILERLIQ